MWDRKQCSSVRGGSSVVSFDFDEVEFLVKSHITAIIVNKETPWYLFLRYYYAGQYLFVVAEKNRLIRLLIFCMICVEEIIPGKHFDCRADLLGLLSEHD